MLKRNSCIWAVLVLLNSGFVSSGAEDPFKMHIRPTDPLTPEEQLKRFHLPEGFKIELVAAEPELRKPMNMAFDASGRLWVTESREYPVAAPTNSRPRDTVRIFSNFDTNGRAQTISTFATNLNIPIGIYPFRSAGGPTRRVEVDGRSATTGALTWKCVVWSIPNIWLFEDTDGNGVADTSRVLYGPFDYTRDTHGNQASFRRGNDGWLYATHGFNNNSEVGGADGHNIKMQSGHTYRMRLDGSRIENWTFGQVNPFGLAFDMFGNLYSADCHSSPIYQLLRSAHYPSFGKPHDGLGFGPVTIQHSHGSTAIAGIVVVEGREWPARYRGNILIGNVMTSRINRDRVEWRGTSTVGHELDDLLKCDDPWFRPVDLQWGPDGALYVADFYNRIIGHYEVPLTHPERDRERGRIWRIRYVGKGSPVAPGKKKTNLLASLGSGNPTTRSLALNELCDVYGRNAIGDLQGLLGAANEHHYVGALWGLHRLKVLSERNLLRAMISKSTLPRLHGMKIAGEWSNWSPNLQSIITKSLHAENAYIRRAAAEALGTRTNMNTVGPLLTRLQRVPAEDTHTRHAVRLAIRNQLQSGGQGALHPRTNWPPDMYLDLAEIALAVKTPESASFILRFDPAGMPSEELQQRAWEHVARHAAKSDVIKMAKMLRSGGGDVGAQLKLFEVIQTGFRQRGEKLDSSLNDWGRDLAQGLLSNASIDGLNWGNLPPNSSRRNETPWALEERTCEDGRKVKLLSSLPKGERLRGRLRSRLFRLPKQLEFYLCGHNAKPDQPERRRNLVRLRLANGRILHEQLPPRNDTARRIVWDLAEHEGRQGFFEASDADADGSYAWLAFGRFTPDLPELKLGDVAGVEARIVSATRLARDLNLASLRPGVLRLLQNPNGSFRVQKEAAAAAARFSAGGLRWAASAVVGDQNIPEPTRRRFAEVLVADGDVSALIGDVMKSTIALRQEQVAKVIAGVKPAAELLLTLAEQGTVSASVLAVGGVPEKLVAALSSEQTARMRKLVATLPSDADSRAELITQRVAGYRAKPGDATKGRQVFEVACAACHQLQRQGGLVGPQLDGIGGRGLERLIEDILDPNRNVDVAFRSQSISLQNGDVVIGLPRREEGATLVIANSTGQETSLKLDEIKDRRTTTRSLMPDNFHEAMTAEQFGDLIAFLLAAPARQ